MKCMNCLRLWLTRFGEELGIKGNGIGLGIEIWLSSTTVEIINKLNLIFHVQSNSLLGFWICTIGAAVHNAFHFSGLMLIKLTAWHWRERGMKHSTKIYFIWLIISCGFCFAEWESVHIMFVDVTLQIKHTFTFIFTSWPVCLYEVCFNTTLQWKKTPNLCCIQFQTMGMNTCALCRE